MKIYYKMYERQKWAYVITSIKYEQNFKVEENSRLGRENYKLNLERLSKTRLFWDKKDWKWMYQISGLAFFFQSNRLKSWISLKVLRKIRMAIIIQ